MRPLMAEVSPIRPAADAHADDAVLVERALEGAAWAKSALYQRHARRVIGMLTRMLSSTADAQDAAQDTFVLAFRDLAQLQRRAAFGGWLNGIAVHQAHRRFRKRKLLAFLGIQSSTLDATFEQVADTRAGPDERAELATLQRLLDGLSANERLAWMLRNVEGYELGEVAEITGASLATVKRRIAAADERITGGAR